MSSPEKHEPTTDLWVLFSVLELSVIRGTNLTFYRLTLPLLAGLLAAGLDLLTPDAVCWVGANGVVSGVNGLLQTVTGFYIAALAAVATFHLEYLDYVPAYPFTLRGKELSRRQFLCYLFGYLTSIGLLVYAVGVALTAVPGLANVLAQPLIRSAAIGVYVFVIAQLSVLTQFGLFFLVRQLGHVVKVPPSTEVKPSIQGGPLTDDERAALSRSPARDWAEPDDTSSN